MCKKFVLSDFERRTARGRFVKVSYDKVSRYFGARGEIYTSSNILVKLSELVSRHRLLEYDCGPRDVYHRKEIHARK